MTLVQKLGILCLANHERAKTGRRSPFYLNCSHVPYFPSMLVPFSLIRNHTYKMLCPPKTQMGGGKYCHIVPGLLE